MRIKFAALGFLLCLAGSAFSQEALTYTCSLGDLQRRVEVFHETGVAVPCEVHYYKDSELPGQRQVLWSASSEEGFCESRAAEFVEQLRGWGWDCSQGSDTGMPEAAPSEDDTGDLAPSDTAEDTES